MKYIQYMKSLLGDFESLLKDSDSVKSQETLLGVTRTRRQMDPLPKQLQHKIPEPTVQQILRLFNRIIWNKYFQLTMPNPHSQYIKLWSLITASQSLLPRSATSNSALPYLNFASYHHITFHVHLKMKYNSFIYIKPKTITFGRPTNSNFHLQHVTSIFQINCRLPGAITFSNLNETLCAIK